MRFYLTVLLFAVNSCLWAQFSDDFGDGDFTNSPTWSGDNANFVVTGLNELQLDAPAVADTSYLSVATTSINNVTWDFYVRMEFNPSGSNLTRVYLVSDNADLKGSLNGYFVMLGGTTDEISLYRQDGLVITEILDGVDDVVDLDPAVARVQVTRDAVGNWEVFRDSTGGYAFVSEGTVLDATHTSTTNFGVFCQYTSSRSDKFFFDNLGDPYNDTSLPTIDTIIVVSPTQLDVTFSEPMDQTTSETASNYIIDLGIGAPATATLDGVDPTLVHLALGTPLISPNTYTVSIANVEDLGGNSILSPTDYIITYFIPGTPVPGDVVVTEFLADATPPVGLPEVEYVELYNNSSQTFDLNGWQLSDGSSTSTFGTYVLNPGEHVLVCGNGDCAQFFVSNSTELNLPALNNAGDDIILTDDLGNTIDSIHYDMTWYHDAAKEDGGWSIEKKIYDASCNDASNWSASVDGIGGTPALQNSVFTTIPDATKPIVDSYIVNSANSVTLTFNEVLDTTIAAVLSLSPTVGSLNWNYTSVQSLNVDAMTLAVNQIYTLTIDGASDCWGNVMDSQEIMIGLPDSIGSEDIILNEVMFNPLTGGSDYVELYNNSDKILDLQELYLANWDDSIANYEAVASVQHLLLPSEYVLLTEDSTDIINDFSIYGVGKFLDTDLPTYPNDSGSVYLLSKDFLIIDFLNYSEDMHFELLSTEDGKSLERLSFDGEMNNPDNWHTAAETADWGTPGLVNSQITASVPTGVVSLDPEIFSPDNDGYQDVLTLNLQFSGTDNIVDVEIFDNRGRLIRLLKDNTFVGPEATMTWDGIADSGEKAAIGSYIILVSVLDQNGNQEQYKLVAVLAGNL